MIDYTHPRRASKRIVPAGQPVVLQRGESVSLVARADGSRIVTKEA